jgi:drug/metabolite transporter (DMT)-like permease
MAGRTGDADGATLGAFAAVVVVGGANFVAVKDTVEELDPLYGAAMRFGLACLIFFAILVARRIPLPRGRALAGAAFYGLLGFGTAYALLYIALVELSAGIGSLLMATVPLLTLALAGLQRTERITARGLVGGALAIGGIAVLSAHSIGGDVPFRYLLAALVAPLAVAQSTIVVKRFPRTDPIATNAVGMLAGTALLTAASWRGASRGRSRTRRTRGSPSRGSSLRAPSRCSGSWSSSSGAGRLRLRPTCSR